MEKIFVIGDIHGSYQLLNKILKYWKPEEEILIFLGDYIDRGKESLQVLRKVIELSKEYKVIALSGNHEQLFLNWLKKPKEMSDFYFDPKVGGFNTVQSFFEALTPATSLENLSTEQMVDIILEHFGDEVEFIKNLRLYYYWRPFIFVHAGINPDVEDFLETSADDFLWIREEFSQVPHKAKEIVVFGHTPTIFLNKDGSSNVWISPCRKKIGIDGGGDIYKGGKIHGVRFRKNSFEIDVVSANDKEVAISHFTL